MMRVIEVCLSEAECGLVVGTLTDAARVYRSYGINNIAELLDNVSRRIIVANGHVPAVVDGAVTIGPKIQPEVG